MRARLISRYCTAVIVFAMCGTIALPVHAETTSSPQGETRLACLPGDFACLEPVVAPLATDAAINQHLDDYRSGRCAAIGPHPDHGCDWDGERSCYQPTNIERSGYCTRHYWSSNGRELAYESVSCNYSAELHLIDYNHCTCPPGEKMDEKTGLCEKDK
jgi:hypothetical protein